MPPRKVAARWRCARRARGNRSQTDENAVLVTTGNFIVFCWEFIAECESMLWLSVLPMAAANGAHRCYVNILIVLRDSYDYGEVVPMFIYACVCVCVTADNYVRAFCAINVGLRRSG